LGSGLLYVAAAQAVVWLHSFEPIIRAQARLVTR